MPLTYKSPGPDLLCALLLGRLFLRVPCALHLAPVKACNKVFASSIVEYDFVHRLDNVFAALVGHRRI